MKIGFCTGIGEDIDGFKAKYEQIIRTGFDYVESSVGSYVNLDPSKISELRAYGPKIEASNGFIPGDYKLVDTDHRADVLDYVKRVGERMSELGVQTVVFGSSRFRNLPEGYDFNEGYKLLVEFTQQAGEIIGSYGRTIAIEPLRPQETNIIRSVAEGAKLVIDVASPYVWLLADAYHMAVINEDLGIIEKAGSMLRHVHIADGPNREFPGSNCDPYLENFAKALRASGYDYRVSSECGYGEDFDNNIKIGCKYMHEHFRA